MNKIPKPGELYRHFKHRLYQVVLVAKDAETGTQVVVYQALYGDYQVYVRALDDFLSPVDKARYPDADQEYRFIPVKAVPAEAKRPAGHSEAAAISPALAAFFEAEDNQEQIRLLYQMKGKVTQSQVDSLGICLDVENTGGSPDQQLDNLIKHLETRMRYDGSRLRKG